jgi:hypothetical protein
MAPQSPRGPRKPYLTPDRQPKRAFDDSFLGDHPSFVFAISFVLPLNVMRRMKEWLPAAPICPRRVETLCSKSVLDVGRNVFLSRRRSLAYFSFRRPLTVNMGARPFWDRRPLALRATAPPKKIRSPSQPRPPLRPPPLRPWPPASSQRPLHRVVRRPFAVIRPLRSCGQPEEFASWEWASRRGRTWPF